MLVWFGLKQYQSKDSVKSFIKILLVLAFREDLELVWIAIVSIGMVWSDLRQHPSEASVKASSRSDLFWLF